MADIVDIGGHQAKRGGQPQPKVIEFIKQLLEHAESGHIQQIAAVWVDQTSFVGDGYAPGGSPEELIPIIGGLEVCKFTLLSEMGLADGK